MIVPDRAVEFYSFFLFAIQYPWSTRQLTVPSTINPVSDPLSALNPFPRYGHSVPSTPTASGHLYMFGGLVRDVVKNDLYVLDCVEFQTTLVNVKGTVPSPRLGHVAALMRGILIVWGGDTKSRPEEEQDEALYLFNIRECSHSSMA